ncbi:MAG: helix-turn-helix domain-containing protein [Bdellovibrionaceae bacterium]|nr:helix-turn-helix domain-containing protein [Pseudobdellovibrionaceae bacterium]
MLKNKEYLPLYKALLALENAEELEMFLTDLCTPSEIQAMADRWKAVKMLDKGLPYRKIYEQGGVSTATVTRVARCLSSGAGGYRLLLARMEMVK